MTDAFGDAILSDITELRKQQGEAFVLVIAGLVAILHTRVGMDVGKPFPTPWYSFFLCPQILFQVVLC